MKPLVSRIARELCAGGEAGLHDLIQRLRQVAVLSDQDGSRAQRRAGDAGHGQVEMRRVVAGVDWDDAGEGQPASVRRCGQRLHCRAFMARVAAAWVHGPMAGGRRAARSSSSPSASGIGSMRAVI